MYIKAVQNAKDKSWAEFKRRYPRADLTKFTTEASIDDSHNVTADVMFEAVQDGLMQSVSGSDPKYWSQAMKDALGLVKDGFPFQLTLRWLEIVFSFSLTRYKFCSLI